MNKKHLLLSFLLLLSSCNEEMSIYDEFANKYNELYPEGYDSEAKWYEYQCVATSYSFDESEKTITSRNFIGYIDFDKESFSGIVTKFELSGSVTKISDGKVTSYKTYYSCLNEGNYYSVEEIKYDDESKNTKLSKGCQNMNYVILKTKFDIDFYVVNGYDNMLNMNYIYESINIYDEHVSFNRVLPYSDHGVKNTKTEYYFNDNLEVNEIIQYEDWMYDEKHPYVISNDLKNQKSIEYLSFCEDVEIIVPIEYDEEYKYNEDLDYIFL